MSSLIAYAKNCSLNEMVETEINILTYNSELWPSWSSYASELSIDIYSHCSRSHTMPLTEGILRLVVNHFQSKLECGETGRESVAAEGRWVGPKPKLPVRTAN